jgi:hypothetical protein
MKAWQLCILMGAVYAAPRVSESVSVVMQCVMTLAGLIFMVLDAKDEIREPRGWE